MMTTTNHKGTRLVKGKRKLEFDPYSLPLRGKTLFLDLPGYKRIEDLEQQLTARGAIIERFLGSNVRYVITNRSRDEIKRSTASSSQSPITPSPFTPSPGSYTSRTLSASTYTTRAQKMVQMSLQRPYSNPTDVLVTASRWKCKVVQIEDVEAELQKLKPSYADTAHRKTVKRFSKVRKLKPPFFKVEDVSRKYRPIVYETDQWPSFKSTSSPRSSPSKPGRGGSGRDFEKRLGYCECCETHYQSLDIHLKGSQHRRYATNINNFKTLDHLIAQSPSLEEFVLELEQMNKELACEDERPIEHHAEKTPLPPLHGTLTSQVLLTPLQTTPAKETATPSSVRVHGELLVTPPYKEAEHTPGFTPLRRSARKRRALENATQPNIAKCSKQDIPMVTPSKESSSSSDCIHSSQFLAEKMALQELKGIRRNTRLVEKDGFVLLQNAQTAELNYWQKMRSSPGVTVDISL